MTNSVPSAVVTRYQNRSVSIQFGRTEECSTKGVEFDDTTPAISQVQRSGKALLTVAAFGLCLVLFLGLAWRSGVFQDELSGESDEAAHYVTALLVHDYAASGFPGTPMAFATTFY